METWELLARESIRDLVARYNSNGDSGRFEQVMELFAPDAVMQLRDRVCTGRDEILTIFSGTKERVRGAASQGYVRHFVATHQIDLIDEAHATGRAYFAVISPSGLDHWGRYIDEYRTVDGQWRFASRRVVVDGLSRTSILPEA
ncbi:MAG: nuclear transport factor 2 family protein [Acidimicrobiia bacterium]